MNTQENILKKNMSPVAIWALALGSIIGFGCFILPSEFLEKAGPAGFLLGILFGAIAMMIIGRNIGFMIIHFPVAGGSFSYAHKMFGRTHAFICGWMLVLGYISLIALNATALSVLAEYLAPDFFKRGYLYTIAGWDVYLPQIIIALFFIILFGIFNLYGGKVSGNLQVIMVMLMLTAVFLVLFGTLRSNETSFDNLQPLFAKNRNPIQCIFSIMAMVPWLFVGFDTIPQSAEEFNFSPQKAKILVYLAILSGACVYIIITICTAMVWPWEQSVDAHYTWLTGTAMEFSIGSTGVVFLAVAICMGIWTGMNGFYLASSRLMMAMARENMLPHYFGRINIRHKTPANAILAAMIISLIAPWFGRQAISWVVDMCSCGTIIGYLYTCLAALKLSWQRHTSKLDILFALSGSLISIGILLLLLVPGQSASMACEPSIALGIWIILGVIFYIKVIKRK